uniref:Lunapark zinc ribbon domain-containing protein n=1 Tax=Araucaria cunninghamii TaxID=56994 RepID=A0A0D6QY52_ARACU
MASTETENVVATETYPLVVTSNLSVQPRNSFFSRIWGAIFRPGKEDFEKKLENLSKEEAAVYARSKKRTQTWRKIARALIVYSVIFELAAVVIALMSTRSPDLTWQMRALRVLPIFALPALSTIMYSAFGNYFRMREKKDQKTLDRLRAERKAKIDELKERTNYYLTQQLIQRYDLDPAAKAAAASALVSKLGAEAGLNVSIQDSSLNQNQGKSHDMEVVQSAGLRNRRPPHTRSHSIGSISTEKLAEQPATTAMPGTPSEVASQQGFVFENHQNARASEGGWIARIAAMLVGEDPTQCYALICSNCHMHNGLARKEDFPYITYYCPHCNAFNGSRKAEIGEGVAGAGGSNLVTDGNESLAGQRQSLSSNEGNEGNEANAEVVRKPTDDLTAETAK